MSVVTMFRSGTRRGVLGGSTIPLRRAFAVAVLGLAIGLTPVRIEAQNERSADSRRPTLPIPRDATLPTLFFIGDSTVRNGRGDGANGQWGWADRIAIHFDTTKINVVNRALGGRSSRTYITQGYWDELLPMLKAGDFVVIQFGHNDASPVNDTTRARGTLPGVGEESEVTDNLLTGEREVVHTFGEYLRRYVADVRERGATPVLVSLVPRNRWEGDSLVRNREDYAGWTREVAMGAGTPFVDLNEIVAREYETRGPAEVQPLFEGDNTHTSLAGAELNARAMISGLQALDPNPLATYLRPSAIRTSEGQ